MNAYQSDRQDMPSKQAVRDQLDRITGSSEFVSSKRSSDFLRFVVNQVLEGREYEISQHAIASSVLRRGADFDPTTDPIVRIQAGRVRRSLKHFYLTEGSADPVLIELPKGTYVPVFRQVEIPLERKANGPAPESVEDEQTPDRWPGILVSPFRNLTGLEENNYLSDGLAADLATELNLYAELCVFLAPDANDERKAHAAADFELRGAIQRGKESLRLGVQLLENPTGQLIWAQSYPFADNRKEGSAPLDELTQEIAALVAEEKGLVSQHFAHTCGRSKPAGSTAYHALLEYYHLDLNFDPERFLAVLETLEAAVEQEPEAGSCWSSLARLYADILGHELIAGRVSMERALMCARRGVELLPNCQKCHIILAMILLLDDQVEEALQEVEIASAFNKESLSFLDAIGYLLILCGDWERGPILSRRAIIRNPFHRPTVHAGLWLDALHRSDWKEGLYQAKSFNIAYSFWGPLMRLVALVFSGAPKGIETEVEQLLLMKPDFPKNSRRLIHYYVKGDHEQNQIFKALKAVDLLD